MDGGARTMKRVALMMTHPTQYHSPWFRALAARPELSIHVYYGSAPTASQQGEGFGKNFEWDMPLLEGYPHSFLRNAGTGSLKDFGGIDTPDIGAVVSEGRYDAWIINGWRTRSEWRTIEACWKAKVPMFIRGDSTLITPRPFARKLAKHFLYKRWMKRFSCYLTVGTLNEQYYEHYGADRSRFIPVRHFVDNEWFSEQAALNRASPSGVLAGQHVDPKSLVVLFAGKFIVEKQPLDVIRAIEKTHAAGTGVHLVMVGDGPLRKQCESFCIDRKLPVTFAGFMNQKSMPAAYAAADLLVMPSVSETWGLVVNEAMASGLPAVVSDKVGCWPDLVIPGVTGEVYPAGDTDALAAKISNYAQDRSLVAQHGEAAQAHIRNYSLHDAVENTVVAVERFAA
jgi:glycosyltransferase involved in cell wall biosynthesis